MESPPSSCTPLRARTLLRLGGAGPIAGVLILTVSGVLLWQMRDYELLAWDTYPIIAASRVRSKADFWGSFTEKLMDGRFAASYYRPLLNLSFAWDYACWGLKPFGYLCSNAVWFALCAAGIYALTRRLAGADAQVGPLVALLFFLLHPTQYEILPAPARRPELMCGFFMTLSLALQLSPKALARRWPPIAPALLTLLAIGSKETGFVLPALSFMVVAACAPRSTWRQRLRQALLSLVPHAIVVGGALAARLAVLRGVGGPREGSGEQLWSAWGERGWYLGRYLVFPQRIMQDEAIAPWLLAGIAIGLGCTLLWMRGGGSAGGAGPSSSPRLGLAVVLGLAWLLLLAVIYAPLEQLRPRYVPALVVGTAPAVGVWAQVLVAMVRRGGRRARWAAVATSVLLVSLLAWQARYSAVFHRYDEWAHASRASREFLEQLRQQVAAAQPGAVVRAPRIPWRAKSAPGAACIVGVNIIDDYTVQAWADLTFPDRRIRVAWARQPGWYRRPAPHTILIALMETYDVP